MTDAKRDAFTSSNELLGRIDQRLPTYLSDLPPQAALDMGILRGWIANLEEGLWKIVDVLAPEDAGAEEVNEAIQIAEDLLHWDG